MPDRSAITERVRREIEALSLEKLSSNDQEIFQSKLLDSLNILNLVVLIEQEYGMRIDPFEVNLTSFETVNRIVDFIPTASFNSLSNVFVRKDVVTSRSWLT